MVAGLGLVASVPLVAQALDADEATDEPGAALAGSRDAITPAGTTPLVAPPGTIPVTPPAETAPSVDTLVDRPIPRDPIPSASSPAVDAESGPGTAAGTTGGDPADTPTEGTEVTDPLTAAYAWDERSPRVVELQRLLGVTADGWYGTATRSAHLDALLEADLPADVVPEQPGPEDAAWAALRQCESGGDYSIVSSSGRYRGAYQFNRTTWDSVAGRHAPELVGVDPAAASPSDQDAMARALYDERGSQPWPHCGRHLP